MMPAEGVSGNIASNKKDHRRDRAWIEIDRQKLRHNVDTLQKLLPPGGRLMPAVKADAYGHGAILVAGELNAYGIRHFCVATVSEAVELRQKGIRGEILIMGYTHPEQFSLLRRYRLTQTVVDYAYARILNHYGRKIRVHIKIDTGMHRLGESCSHLEMIVSIFRLKNLRIKGLYTHLCAADSPSGPPEADKHDFTVGQAGAFEEVVVRLKKQGLPCPAIHLAASYGLLNYPELAGDYARVGIALYGVISNRNDCSERAGLLAPILSLKTRIAAIKELMPGETVGYGRRFVAARKTSIAILTIGYADGLPRALSCGVGQVLINGHHAPVVGTICMDQTIVDITAIPQVAAGDVAVIIGASGESEISVYDLAEQAGTITNELLSRLGSRLCRIMV